MGINPIRHDRISRIPNCLPWYENLEPNRLDRQVVNWKVYFISSPNGLDRQVAEWKVYFTSSPYR